MLKKFVFKNFEPTADLKFYLDRSLRRVLDLTPYGSTAFAIVEKQDTDFRCSVDIYSSQGPFAASAVGVTPDDAIRCALNKFYRPTEKWSQVNNYSDFNFFRMAT